MAVFEEFGPAGLIFFSLVFAEQRAALPCKIHLDRAGDLSRP